MEVMLQPQCAWWGCDRPRKSRGWCGLHYMELYRGGEIVLPPRWRGKPCRCGAPAVKAGCCQRCYDRGYRARMGEQLRRRKAADMRRLRARRKEQARLVDQQCAGALRCGSGPGAGDRVAPIEMPVS